MKILEIITESGKKGGMKKINPSQKAAMKNASTLPALNMNSGSMYLNYRMGVALAGAPDFPTKMEADNWIAGDPLLSTYTDEEFEMFMSWSEREEFLKENPSVQPTLTAAPALVRGTNSNNKVPEGFKEVLSDGGYRGLYRGFHYALMRAIPLHATAFMTFELCKKYWK